MSQNAVANLGWNNIKLTHPVYVGDTIYAESVCTDKRPSKSRPDMGIISMMTRALNQDGDVVMTYDRSVMIPTRASGIGQNYFPQAKAGPMEVPARSAVAAGRWTAATAHPAHESRSGPRRSAPGFVMSGRDPRRRPGAMWRVIRENGAPKGDKWRDVEYRGGVRAVWARSACRGREGR